MNVTIAVPMTNGMIERRRATHAGVTGLRLELADGTQIEITEKDGGIMVAAPSTPCYLTITPYVAHAVQISAVRCAEEEHPA